MARITRSSVSTTPSSAVGTVTSAVREPARKLAVSVRSGAAGAYGRMPTAAARAALTSPSRVSTNTASSPSTTLAARAAMVTGGASSSMIVPKPRNTRISAFRASLRVTPKFSIGSATSSSISSTVIVFATSPTAKVSVPLPAT